MEQSKIIDTLETYHHASSYYKHIWLYTKYMPMLNWWIGAIVYRSRLWLLNDECHPTHIHRWSNAYALLILIFPKLLQFVLLLQSLQNYYCYCHRYYCYYYGYYQNYQTTLLLNTLLQIINLQVWFNWQLGC